MDLPYGEVYRPLDLLGLKDYSKPKNMTELEADLQYVEEVSVAATKQAASTGCEHHTASVLAKAHIPFF